MDGWMDPTQKSSPARAPSGAKKHKDDVGCVDDSVGVDGVCVIDGVGIDGGVFVYASDENVSKYEERLEKEFEECCI